MKKVVIYILLTILVGTIALTISNFGEIMEAVANFPKDRFLWYLLGSLTTWLALGGKPTKKKGSTDSLK